MGTARDKSFWTDATTGVLNDSGKRAFERDSFPDLVETVFSEKPILAGFSSAISTASDATSVSLTDEVLLDQSGTVAAGTLQQVRGSYLLTEETANFTLALTHTVGITPVNKASQADVTIPANATTAIAIGSEMHLLQVGAGAIRLLPEAGVIVRLPPGTNTITVGKGAEVKLRKIATDEWVVPSDGSNLGWEALQGLSNIHGAYSCSRRLLASYNGPLLQLREAALGATMDVYPNALNEIDLGAIADFAGVNALSVSTLYDQGGSGLDFAQETVANQPVFTRNSQNGQPTIDFTAASDHSLTRAVSGDALFGNASNALNVVADITNVSGSAFYSESLAADPDVQNMYQVSISGGTFRRFIRNAAATTVLNDDSSGTISGEPKILSIADAAGTITNRFDSEVDGTMSYTPEAITLDEAYIGGRRGGAGITDHPTMSFTEMVAFDAAMSATDLATLEMGQLAYYGV